MAETQIHREPVESNDKGIDIEDILKEIKERVRHKREMGIYSDKDVEELYSLNLLCGQADRLRGQIRLLNDCYDFRSGINITSHRPVMGKLIVAIKKGFIALAIKLAAPLFDRQVSFNFHLLQTMDMLVKELETLKNEQSKLMLRHENDIKLLTETLEKLKGEGKV